MSVSPVLPIPISNGLDEITFGVGAKKMYVTEPELATEGRMFAVLSSNPSQQSRVTFKRLEDGVITTVLVNVNPTKATWNVEYPMGSAMILPGGEGADGFKTLGLKGVMLGLTEWKLYFTDEADNLSPEIVRFTGYLPAPAAPETPRFPIGPIRQKAHHLTWVRFVLLPHRYTCPGSQMGMLNMHLDKDSQVLHYKWLQHDLSHGDLLTSNFSQGMLKVTDIPGVGVVEYYFGKLDAMSVSDTVARVCWDFEIGGDLVNGAVDPASQTWDAYVATIPDVIEELYPNGLIDRTSGGEAVCVMGVNCAGDLDSNSDALIGDGGAQDVPPTTTADSSTTDSGTDIGVIIGIVIGALLLLIAMMFVAKMLLGSRRNR